MLFDGSVDTPLDEQQLRAQVEILLAAGVEAIAVAYLFSFMNPSHERRTRDIIQQMAPAMLVSLSSDVLPKWGEFQRTSTTVIDAHLKPLLNKYLKDLDAKCSGLGIGRLQIMQSNGGAATPDTAAMGTSMIRTSFSPVFNEARDFIVVVFDKDVELLAQVDFVSAMLGSARHGVKLALHEIGIDNLDPGDIIITNDPYRSNNHIPEHIAPGMFSSVRLNVGDEVLVITGNGAGYGDPFARDPEKVVEDIHDELLSMEQASEYFGVVVCRETMAVDIAATKAAREKRVTP